MSTDKLGFVGFGEATINIVEGLLTENNWSFYVYDIDYEAALIRKEERKLKCVTLVNDLEDILSKCTIVFVAVPGFADEEIFSSIMKNKKKQNLLFIDICTAKPDVKKRISEKINCINSKYVDVAVMGSVPKFKHKVPMMVSGSGAEDFKHIFSNYNMNIKIVGIQAGIASVIKLCRSIYMKGLAALLIETKKVSQAFKVEEEVFDSIAESMDADDFVVYSQRLIKGTYTHCVRRRAEVAEVLDLISSAGISSYLTEGTLKLYDDIVKIKAEGK